MPRGVDTNDAWWLEASTSGMTTSLSNPRPMRVETTVSGSSCRGSRVVGRSSGCGTGPSSNVNSGPSGSPTWMVCPSRMATELTRRCPTNIPLKLLSSTATQCPSRQRSTTCDRETPRCGMRTSARTSRPMTMSRPGANVRCQPPERTVIGGGSGRLIWPTISVGAARSPLGKAPSRNECISVHALGKAVVPQGDYLLPQLRCRGAGGVDGIADVDAYRGWGVVAGLGQHVGGAQHCDGNDRHPAVPRQSQGA